MRDVRTLEDLPQLSQPELQAWVRQGVLSWSRAANHRDKISAFSPAVLSLARSEDTAASLGHILRATFPRAEARPAEAAAAALEGWAPLADGVTGAALLIRLCAYLAAARLEEVLENFLLKPEARLLEPSDDLSSTLANAARERLSRRGARRVAILACRAKAMGESDAARVAAFIIGDQIEKLPALLAELGLPRTLQFDIAARWMVLSLCEYRNRTELAAGLAALRTAGSKEQQAIAWIQMAVATLDEEEAADAQPPDLPTPTEQNIIELMSVRFPGATWDLCFTHNASLLDSMVDVNPDQDSTDFHAVIHLRLIAA